MGRHVLEHGLGAVRQRRLFYRKVDCNMPQYWGYISNDKYAVGCTGQTVHVHNASGKELARFKDLKYAYNPMFCPEHEMLVVKSTIGQLAVYSLEKMMLIKKFRFSKVDHSQDDGFCFSKDGKLFYNIEQHFPCPHSYPHSCLSIYETSGFQLVSQQFLEEKCLELNHIEYDAARDSYFVLGHMRKDGAFDYGFIAAYTNNELEIISKVGIERFFYIVECKSLELLGFAPKAMKYFSSRFKGGNHEPDTHITLFDMTCGEGELAEN